MIYISVELCCIYVFLYIALRRDFNRDL